MLELGLAWGAVISFGISSGLLWHALKQANTREFGWGSISLGAGAALSVAYMLVVSYRLGAFPIINKWIGASFLGFLLAAFALAAWVRYREKTFLAGAAPVATAFALLASFRSVKESDLSELAARLSALRPEVPGIGYEILTSTWFPAHVTLAMAAYALFALAATMGLLQLALIRVLKAKRGGRPLEFLPSLPVVEKAGGFAVGLGLVFLASSLLIGTLGAHAALDQPLLGDPKEVAGLTILTLYCTIELIRKIASWPGRRTAIAHVGAFVVLLAVFVGSSFFAAHVGGGF
jgi:ABC-type uncharacterized transport system permease subunit